MKTLLVVDDDESIRALLDDMLSPTYRVLLAADAQQALDLFSREQPDLVVLDIRMPGIDGLTLLNRLRETARDLPIIIFSAFEEYRQDIKTWASDAYVVKSPDVDKLQTAIEKLLGEARSS